MLCTRALLSFALGFSLKTHLEGQNGDVKPKVIVLFPVAQGILNGDNLVALENKP
jgi:hypothetical protein